LIQLTKIYRQDDAGIGFLVFFPLTLGLNPPDFIYALNRCRIGLLDEKSFQLLASCSRPLDPKFLPQYRPIWLFCTRKEVKEFNKQRLASIPDDRPKLEYISYDWFYDSSARIYLKNLPIDSRVVLKVEAQVILLRNLDRGLTNGTVGVVKGFYASTEVMPDLSSNYNKKTGFLRHVAVTPQGIPISYSPDNVNRPPKEVHFPLVEFHTSDGPEHVLLMRQEFSVDIGGKYVAKRVQVLDQRIFLHVTIIFLRTDSPCIGMGSHHPQNPGSYF
jgi:hypothetical protein